MLPCRSDTEASVATRKLMCRPRGSLGTKPALSGNDGVDVLVREFVPALHGQYDFPGGLASVMQLHDLRIAVSIAFRLAMLRQLSISVSDDHHEGFYGPR